MNFKDYLSYVVPFVAAVSITVLVQRYIFDSGAQRSDSPRSRVAPHMEEVSRPLNYDVEFVADETTEHTTELTAVETQFAQYVFTSEGGLIDRLSFKHSDGNDEMWLQTVYPEGRNNMCFLVALSRNTPYYYKLVKNESSEDVHTLVYQAPFEYGFVNKEYRIFKQICKMEVRIGVELTSVPAEPVQMRLFYPSPRTPELADDVIHALINYGNALDKKKLTSLSLGGYWEPPITLFGTESRYFIATLVSNPDHFAQRAYFKVSGTQSAISILEGKPVKESMSATMTFYVGPKRASLMSQVDERLEQTLDYGWFAPISRIFLLLLNLINDFVKNYGIAIILLTVFIKLLLLPFTWQGEQSAKKMAEMKRKLDYLQQKYKHDSDALARERAELMRKHGMPGMSGCLPMLLQVPMFIALQRILAQAVELYQAPFFWIPNLSAKDPYFILPILVTASMIMHAMIMNRSTDARQGVQSLAFALVFGAITASISAGLGLYLLTNMVLTVAQTSAYRLLKEGR